MFTKTTFPQANQKALYRRLLAGTAICTCTILLGASHPANAACSTSGTEVSCSGEIDSNDIQSAIPSGSDLTLTLDDTAAVDLSPGSIAISKGGVVSVENAGNIGEDSRSPFLTSLSVIGDSSADGNSLTLTNDGNIYGGVVVTDFGGDIELTNNAHIDRINVFDANGSVTLGNNSAETIEDDVIVDAAGNINFDNPGRIFGDVSLSSNSSTSTSDTTTTTDSTTEDGTTTTVTTTTTTFESADEGGDVEGVYSGTVGALNDLTGGLSGGTLVSQTADGSSSMDISGTIFEDVSSTAGGSSQDDEFVRTETRVDSDGDPEDEQVIIEEDEDDQLTANAGSESTVTITGAVRESNDTGVGGNVTSVGDYGSTVTVDGGRVEGSITSTTGAVNRTFTEDDRTEQNRDSDGDGDLVTTSIKDQSESVSTLVGGSSVVDIRGASVVEGSVTANGVAGADGAPGAQVSVDAFSTVQGDVNVNVLGTDSTFTSSTSFSRDVDSETATRTDISSLMIAPAANNGDAAANVEGTVFGGLDVDSNNGDATATVTGTVGTFANVSAVGATQSNPFRNPTQEERSGTVGSPSAEVPPLVQRRTEFSTTYSGGTASLVVDSAESIAQSGQWGVGNALASTSQVEGFERAELIITDSSKVRGDFIVRSLFQDVSGGTTTDYEGGVSNPVNRVSASSTTQVGGTAFFRNASENSVGSPTSSSNSVSVIARDSVEIENPGWIFGSLSGDAVAENMESETVTENIGDDADEVMTSTTTYSPVGGTGSISTGGLVTGSVSLSAADGSVANPGVIGGSISVGESVRNWTETTTETTTSTDFELTEAENQFSQMYTVEQSGLLVGGISVNGATATPDAPTDSLTPPLPITTSDVQASINLNDGAVTLGSIQGQRNFFTGMAETTTDVNLNGSGYVGMNALYDPALSEVLPGDMQEAASQVISTTAPVNMGVRIQGVRNLNKTGSGAYVINGAAFVDNDGSANDVYTIDAETVTVNEGSLELGIAGYSPSFAVPGATPPEFGISADVQNNAALVVGRSVDTDNTLVLDNLLADNDAQVDGIHVRQSGDFTQSSSGTLVIGMAPDLLRAAPQASGTGSAPEPLGFVDFQVSTTAFTIPSESGISTSTPSHISVNGNLTLNGTVTVAVNEGAIYTGGDGYELFRVTGDTTVGAEAVPSVSSPFVGFDLITSEDSGETVVSVETTRSPYASAATSENATVAASALDSARSNVVSRITDDANDQAAFNSVEDFRRTQDMATVMAGLDWSLGSDDAGQALNELGGGAFYGSLGAIRTTQTMSDALGSRMAGWNGEREAMGSAMVYTGATSGATAASSDTVLWASPSGSMGSFDGNAATGARELDVDTYGISFGVDAPIQGTGNLGFGFGYLEHDAVSDPAGARADSKSYQLGIYGGSQVNENIYLNGQFIYSWSDYDAQRSLPLFARTATAEFDGKEWLASGEIGYDYYFSNGSAGVTPFANLKVRHFSLDGFQEEGAGGIGLNMESRSKTVFNPEIGARLYGELAGVRPFASASYTYQGGAGTDRTASFLGGGDEFTLQGVDPDGYGLVSGGVSSDLGRAMTFEVKVSHAFAGGQKNTSLRGGLSLQF